MGSRMARWTVAICTIAVAAAFLLCTAATALAQENQPEPDEGSRGEIPLELQEKIAEFREAAAGLREPWVLLKVDGREFRSGRRELFQKARSLSRDERWDLIDRISAARDEYAATVEGKLKAARENVAALKECLAGARQAWEQGDLDATLSGLDQAMAKVDELKGQLGEAHGLFQEILELQRQLIQDSGAAPASLRAWAT